MIAGDANLYDLATRSKATVQIDMATGNVTLNMNLIGTRQPGSVVRQLDYFEGTGRLDPATGTISGTLTQSDYSGATIIGSVGGAVFGAQAREIGLVFSIEQNDVSVPSQWHMTASGD